MRQCNIEKSKLLLLNFTLFIFFGGIIISSCKKDTGAVPGQFSDALLYQLSKDTTGHVYYQSGATLPPAGSSPHGSFKLRFNAKANSVLTLGGEIPPGQTFPDSSLIVKDIYNGNTLSLYAVMYKRSGTWEWAEYDLNGKIVYSIGKKGSGCIPCHSGGTNRDLVNTFDLH